LSTSREGDAARPVGPASARHDRAAGRRRDDGDRRLQGVPQARTRRLQRTARQGAAQAAPEIPRQRLGLDSPATGNDSAAHVGGVKRLRQNDGQLSLVCSDRNITKIFEITGLDRVFTIYATRDEAVGAGSTA